MKAVISNIFNSSGYNVYSLSICSLQSFLEKTEMTLNTIMRW